MVFTKAACALGFHAKRRPEGYAWCYHPGLAQRPLADGSSHWNLADDEIASDGEDEPSESRADPAAAPNGVLAAGAGAEAPRRRRVLRPRPEAEAFMLRLGLAPPDGFPDPASTDDEGAGGSEPSRPQARARVAAQVELQEQCLLSGY